MEVSRRTALGAALGAAGAAALLPHVAVTPAAAAGSVGSYGSGVPADWSSAARMVSPDDTVAAAVGRGVWVLGDSISREDHHDLEPRLTALGLPVAVDAWGSRPTAPTVDVLERWTVRFGAPRVLVMAVGTNDIPHPPAVAAQVDRVMAVVGPTLPVLWVNVYAARWVHGWGGRESDQRNSAWINGQLAEATARYPNLGLVRWYEWLCGNPGYRLSNGLRDGVHTTALGRNARNLLIERAVAGALS